MPFLEVLDGAALDRMARKEPIDSARVVKIDLRECDSLEAAQSVLAALLWDEDGKLSPFGVRCTRMAVKITKDADSAMDVLQEAWLDTARAFWHVRDANAYLMQAVRSHSYLVHRRRSRAPILVEDIASVGDIAQAEDEWALDVVDAAARSLNLLMEQATPAEVRIIALMLKRSWDNTLECPELADVARELGITLAHVQVQLRALGKRAGVWSNDRQWRPEMVGPRRSDQWHRGSERSVWSTLGWFGLRSAMATLTKDVMMDLIVRACTLAGTKQLTAGPSVE